MTKPIKIAINGFGRIGRTILRCLLTTRMDVALDVVLINDISDIDLCAHLFEFDSVFGPYHGGVEVEGDTIRFGPKQIGFSQSADLRDLDLSDIDLVIESTGQSKTRAFAERGLMAGAGRVLISGPCETADLTLVLGANDDELQGQKVVSNASCTTNALAPLLKVLDDGFGIKTGHMTTIHCYTGSQPTIDAPRGDMARSRAAALSMVPTTTSAARLIDKVLPHLAGRVVGCAVRVPTASVSAVDLTVQLSQAVTHEQVQKLLHASQSPIIGLTEKPLVSTDLRARAESIVMAMPETTVLPDGLVRVFGWYDNEWGFSNRMIDVALRMGPA
ncbi:type I glyceraldehyde-3-phosphate dehydrogenase [Algirhabdus cladophorae]|uniref:type I glyceraldehyde-3-phosphate dehydrogenase n=1 Tax=Algirhabdus cladophorae TaxID=3377108 RepID=UPI003B84A236